MLKVLFVSEGARAMKIGQQLERKVTTTLNKFCAVCSLDNCFEAAESLQSQCFDLLIIQRYFKDRFHAENLLWLHSQMQHKLPQVITLDAFVADPNLVKPSPICDAHCRATVSVPLEDISFLDCVINAIKLVTESTASTAEAEINSVLNSILDSPICHYDVNKMSQKGRHAEQQGQQHVSFCGDTTASSLHCLSEVAASQLEGNNSSSAPQPRIPCTIPLLDINGANEMAAAAHEGWKRPRRERMGRRGWTPCVADTPHLHWYTLHDSASGSAEQQLGSNEEYMQVFHPANEAAVVTKLDDQSDEQQDGTEILLGLAGASIESKKRSYNMLQRDEWSLFSPRASASKQHKSSIFVENEIIMQPNLDAAMPAKLSQHHIFSSKDMEQHKDDGKDKDSSMKMNVISPSKPIPRQQAW